jgi:hypothetical protein
MGAVKQFLELLAYDRQTVLFFAFMCVDLSIISLVDLSFVCRLERIQVQLCNVCIVSS